MRQKQERVPSRGVPISPRRKFDDDIRLVAIAARVIVGNTVAAIAGLKASTVQQSDQAHDTRIH